MAFEVKFGKSDKRINSTKIPELTESATCVLKNGTSVEKPTFILQGVTPFDWNVAYCATFGRYYFVNDVTYVESTYEISCTCDYWCSCNTELSCTCDNQCACDKVCGCNTVLSCTCDT